MQGQVPSSSVVVVVVVVDVLVHVLHRAGQALLSGTLHVSPLQVLPTLGTLSPLRSEIKAIWQSTSAGPAN